MTQKITTNALIGHCQLSGLQVSDVPNELTKKPKRWIMTTKPSARGILLMATGKSHQSVLRASVSGLGRGLRTEIEQDGERHEGKRQQSEMPAFRHKARFADRNEGDDLESSGV